MNLKRLDNIYCKMFMFKSILLNGVRLVVYPDGSILRYHKGTTNKYITKGWNIAHGHIDDEGYRRLNIAKRSFKHHRIVAHTFLGLDLQNGVLVVDHIDRNKLNNCVSNLRLVTRQQNNFNTDAKGIRFDKRYNNYQSRIQVNKKSIHLGMFKTKEEAQQAYLIAKEKYHLI
jgi:hypothetical protein